MARKKRSRKKKPAYESGPTVVRFRSPRSHPHLATEYLDMGKPDIAHELVRDLRGRHQRAVIGHIKRPEAIA